MHLHPHIAEGGFSGFVTIKLTTTTERSWFAVHQKYLEISSTELFDSSLTPVDIFPPTVHAEYEFWVILPISPMAPGDYILNMTFTGSLTRDIVGFYRSTYSNGDIQRYSTNVNYYVLYLTISDNHTAHLKLLYLYFYEIKCVSGFVNC